MQKAIRLGHPSYVWRRGQDRRLALIQRYVPLEGRSILDVGCGIGTYVAKFRDFSADVHGVDIDPERVAQASLTLPNIRVAPAEHLPYPDNRFDVILLHEVIEHVDDDRAAIREAYRCASPGGHIVIYAPNRLYPFETHGCFILGRYVFGVIPLVNYFPDVIRNVFCPHVRVYLGRDIRRLFADLDVRFVVHTYIYPGFDNIAARWPLVGRSLQAMADVLERTPLRRFGISHFVVAQKLG
jgi:SAM-dependent methyltransferase